MKVQTIQQTNEAVFILRHFIDLSAKLLPMLYKLDCTINPSEIEQNDKKRIMDVFQSYNFETQTSLILLESDILKFIKNCYLNIHYDTELVQKKNSLTDFLNEYNRLKKNWRMIENN